MSQDPVRVSRGRSGPPAWQSVGIFPACIFAKIHWDRGTSSSFGFPDELRTSRRSGWGAKGEAVGAVQLHFSTDPESWTHWSQFNPQGQEPRLCRRKAPLRPKPGLSGAPFPSYWECHGPGAAGGC